MYIYIYSLGSQISFFFTEILPLVEKTAYIRTIDYTFYLSHHPRMNFCGKGPGTTKFECYID